MDEERLSVLRMLSEGRVNSGEANEVLDAIEASREGPKNGIEGAKELG